MILIKLWTFWGVGSLLSNLIRHFILGLLVGFGSGFLFLSVIFLVPLCLFASRNSVLLFMRLECAVKIWLGHVSPCMWAWYYPVVGQPFHDLISIKYRMALEILCFFFSLNLFLLEFVCFGYPQ